MAHCQLLLDVLGFVVGYGCVYVRRKVNAQFKGDGFGAGIASEEHDGGGACDQDRWNQVFKHFRPPLKLDGSEREGVCVDGTILRDYGYGSQTTILIIWMRLGSWLCVLLFQVVCQAYQASPANRGLIIY